MPKIMFICKANQFRSPLAAACFSHKVTQYDWKGKWVTQSAGTWAQAGFPALPVAVAIGQRLGLSLERHRTQIVNAELLAAQNLILVMESGQKESLRAQFPQASQKIFLLSEITLGQVVEITDPIQSDEKTCLEVALQTCEMIERGFFKICAHALKPRAVTLPSL